MRLLAIIHQTTTTRSPSRARVQCVYWRLYIKPQLSHRTAAHQRQCVYWRLYIKPQPRICKRLRNKTIIYLKFARKWRCKYLIAAKLLKKFQLYRLRDFLFLDGAPNIDNVAVLSICNNQNAYFAMLRYK